MMKMTGFMKGAAFMVMMFSCEGMAQDIVQLPLPEQVGGLSVAEALKLRHSGKNFSDRGIDAQTLSNILWAAWGINRNDGKRTVPTVMNEQNMNVYAVSDEGVWRYDALLSQLEPVSESNVVPYLATQEYAVNAPLFLLYTTTGEAADFNAAMQAGSMYQNVALYCASAGLNNVVRSYFDRASVAATLGIAENTILVSQVVGYPL